jgi:DNA-binding transcriptional LysR family regulator
MDESIAKKTTLIENLHLLHRFLAVAEAGTMAEAAQKLSLTPPSLTRSIQSLEASLNVQLFERHSMGVRLTPSGKILLSHIKAVERELHYAAAELTAFRQGHRGTLRIGAMPFFAHHVMPPKIALLQERYAQYRIELSVGTGYNMFSRLIDGELDMVTISTEATGDLPPFIGNRSGPSVRIVIVANRDHPIHAASGASALLDYPWAMYGEDRENLVAVNHRMTEIAGGPPNIAMVSASLEAIFQTVANGRYITWIAEPLLSQDRAGFLQPVASAQSLFSYQSQVLFRRSMMNVAPFRFLMDQLKQAFADSPGDDEEPV